MKKILAMLLGMVISLALTACAPDPEPPVTPVPGKLTFLYFYTEG